MHHKGRASAIVNKLVPSVLTWHRKHVLDAPPKYWERLSFEIRASHEGASTSTERAAHLETWSRCNPPFPPYHIQDRVNELSALSEVAIRPIIAGANLAENQVVGLELIVGARSNHLLLC